MAKGKHRKGRGRLSSVDLLPDHADEVIAWALDALRERDITQTAILVEFNARLTALDPPVAAISKSAFNRYSIRFAVQARHLTEARAAAAAMAERLGEQPEGDVGLMLGETIKALINGVLMDGMLNGESPSIKMLREASDALHRLERARNDNAKTAVLSREKFMRQAEHVVTVAATETGTDPQELLAAIRKAVAG